jgi:hypothetical protein
LEVDGKLNDELLSRSQLAPRLPLVVKLERRKLLLEVYGRVSELPYDKLLYGELDPYALNELPIGWYEAVDEP